MRLLIIDAVSTILGELLHGVVISKNIAVDAAQQGNGNFKYWNKEVIR